MIKKVNVAIIGAGTAGISAFKEASKYTNDIVLIDKGPIGTTCARVGCMPSKQLIHIANQFYERCHFNKMGIEGADKLEVNIPKVMTYVRKMRDHFTSGVIDFIQSLNEKFICEEAKFLDANTLQVGKQQLKANKIIIASGSSSIIPDEWEVDSSKILISENIFEQENFPKEIGVIGGGIIGLELGQALSRLGVNVSLYHADKFIGGLTDPVVNDAAIEILSAEFPIYLNEKVSVNQNSQNDFNIQFSGQRHSAESILAAIGRRPNLKNLNIDVLDIEFDEFNVPKYDKATLQINHLPIYIAGDVNKTRPLLHEASDEGKIAGYNAANDKNKKLIRRTSLRILFSQPNIVVVGKSFSELNQNECVIGAVSYDDQGRAKIENHNKGILRIYAMKNTGKLLGAEGITPAGEHMAHLLAWAIQQKMTVFEMLQMPFYHPVIEEGMRTALHDITKKLG